MQNIFSTNNCVHIYNHQVFFKFVLFEALVKKTEFEIFDDIRRGCGESFSLEEYVHKLFFIIQVLIFHHRIVHIMIDLQLIVTYLSLSIKLISYSIQNSERVYTLFLFICTRNLPVYDIT